MSKLTIAVPSKGRIMDATYAFFADAGLAIERPASAREYVGKLKDVAGAEVLFMSSAEIAAALVAGTVHVGVTGEDLMRETAVDLDARVALIKPLGFGFANVVTAVPAAWIDVRTMADLDDVCADFRARHKRPLRVATKYSALTRRFFAERGLVDYRIVESSGATEGAPAAGVAEIVVDITTTGATMAANNLRTLADGVILCSQAQLAASLRARWSKATKETFARLLDRVTARDAAKATRIVGFRLSRRPLQLKKDLVATGCMMTREPPPDGELQCPEGALDAVVAGLKAAGAGAITVRAADFLFDSRNPLFAAFAARLG